MLFPLSTHPLEIADFGVLRASLPFRSRGTILPANLLDLFSLGVAGRIITENNWFCEMSEPAVEELCPSGCTCDAPET